MPKHYIIFIHGIGELENNNPDSLGYNALWTLLKKQSGLSLEAFDQQFDRINVVWHVGQLQKAEETLSKATFPDLKPGLFNPIMPRLRNFMTFFVGDVAAYVSEDVNFIRRTVWDQIWSYQDNGKSFKELLADGATYSIIAHSLGSVIAFDYLFHLFEPNNSQLFVPCANTSKRPEDAQLTAKDHELVQITSDELKLLTNRFRHFFSMGSPIALFLMRKGALWAGSEPFSTVYNPVRPEPGNGRVWCNFWDSEDAIAYPLKNVFDLNPDGNKACKLLDIPVETGMIFSAHVDYWKNRTVAQEIMKWVSKDD